MFDLKSAVAVLESTPRVLDTWLRGLGDEWVHADEGPDTFSPFDVLGHLIQGEKEDWIARAGMILASDELPVFEPFDRFAQLEADRGRDMHELLDEFSHLRRQNLETLYSFQLGPEHLELVGIHPELGKVTLRELLSTWVVHDLGHIAQIARVMAKHYGAMTGPWARYLPVLRDREPA
jgi:hypothetical protein